MFIMLHRKPKYFIFRLIWCSKSSDIYYLQYFIWELGYHGVVVITTAQLYSIDLEPSVNAGSNLACKLSDICDGENLWQWFWL